VGEKPLVWSVALILAGGIGNLIDRIIHGYVVDFLSFWSFPVFNFADCCVVIGTFLLLFHMLRNDAIKIKESQIATTNADSERS
jgi:signal peptidase II